MEKFTLQHTVLYAKGWYKRSRNFWEDIKKCLSADGYSGEIFSKNDCMNVIINQFQDLPHKRAHNLLTFVSAIQESECWKYGYYTKNNGKLWGRDEESKDIEYDISEAIVRYCLSQFAHMKNTEWDKCPPDFKKCLPRKNGITDKKVKEMFGELV